MAIIDKGKQAEYLCAAELLGLGITPCWPSVETQPFDIVAVSGAVAHRLQIKGSIQSTPTVTVRLKMQDGGRNRRYTKQDVDFIVIYLYESLDWYVLPVDDIKKTSISLKPKSDKCKWKKYRNAWHLLK